MSSGEDDEIKSKLLVNGNQEEEEEEEEEEDDDEEEEASLLPMKPKKNQKVQWNDSYGNDLTQVLEYQPSEASELDDDESDVCLCSIM